MLSRFDTNGNKMIDPSEAQGPAQFFLQRLAQSNPKIDLKKPIPISQLTEEISRMRGGDSGGGSTSRESDEPELLVPNFSLDYVPEPVMGFGAGSSVFNVKVEERDLKEAEDRLSRYDRDRNGLLNKEELQAGRWSDDPMQYDRNRDGQLNKSEMAVRYANRRVQDEERRNASNDSRSNSSRDSSRGGGENGWGRRGEAQPEEEEVARFGDAKSYRSASGAAAGTSGLPDFFARSDADGDGQVLMSEFSSSWTQSTLEEFQKWDLNKDGIIIASECLAALDAGTRVTASASSAPAGGSTPGASRPTSVAGSGGSSSPVAIGGTQMEWATRQIEKYDKNGDGQLTASEWEAMIIKPIGADANGDGILTAEEYAEFRAKK
jgi:Ca2+-binding EF-hand superfamily protein